MRKIFPALLLSLIAFVFFSPARSQVLNGNITLATQAEVDAFNFTEVNGIITITGTTITNLNGLSELVKCNSLNVFNNPNLTSIIGLASLEEVKDDLTFRTNASLVHLVGLSSLTKVGTAPPDALTIESNPSLVDIDGLFSLTFAHSLRINNNANLADVDGLSALDEVVDFFSISGNGHLTNLDGLSNFTKVSSVNGNLLIQNNDALTSIIGLSNLAALPGLIVKDNLLLPNLDGLSKVTFFWFGGLTIENNAALVNIDGLANITTTNCDVKINDNPSLTSIGLTSFHGVNDIGGAMSMELKNNDNLTNLDGLSSMFAVRAGHFYIEDNAKLENVNGLSQLNLVGAEFAIRSNPKLESIVLPKLEAVAGLAIASNSILTYLDLPKLKVVVYDLIVRFNPMLTDFCGLSTLFDEGEIGRNIAITNNGANTVSITPPPDIILPNDPGKCTGDISNVAPYVATVTGCLNPAAPSSSSPISGNVYPVGTTDITWSVYDGAGNSATAVQHVVINDVEKPTITAPADIAVTCATDVPTANPALATANDNCPDYAKTHVGDVKSNEICANRFKLTRTYMVTDHAGNTATASQVITVNDNVPPRVVGLSTSQVILWPANHTMRDITLTYTVEDNCVNNPSYSMTISSNEAINGQADGDTGPDWEIIDDHHIRLRAERAANGTGRIYTITVTVNDGCNTPVVATATVQVPHNITGPHSGQQFRIGSTVDFAGEFWDRPTNKHTAKWSIDNASVKGTLTEPTVNKKGKVIGSYKFTSPGVYKLQMNTTDQTGVTSYSNTNGDLEEIVVIYDPNGGYTYGGGWFTSQPGALVDDPSAEGKASYGFTVNYFKNSTYPKGETQFEFKVGSFEFNALNFDYMVINGARAQFKGTGKITGDQSGYGFIMTVIDGDLDGSGVDKIRMKVYNKTNGRVVYDNQPDASDAADPVTAVETNSSVIIYSTANNLLTKSEIPTEELCAAFEVKATPNPSIGNFILNVRSSDLNAQIKMQVVDMYGRLLETKIVTANSTFMIGNNYRPGVYILKIEQGKNQKQIKLVKLPE